MAFSVGGRKQKTFNEINITPLTDIFLVLMIIMMVLAPMFQTMDKSIHVPKIQAGTAISDESVTLEINKEGDYLIDGKTIPANHLSATLKSLSHGHPAQMTLIVRADRETDSPVVIDVFDAASLAGYKHLTIAGDPSTDDKDKVKAGQ